MEEASNLKVVKPTTDGKEMGRILENAVQYGWPLLFEDADEIIDPQFDTILEKNIEVQAGAEMIKIGDQMREYN